MFSPKPHPWGELDVLMSGLRPKMGDGGKQYPHPAAISRFAPPFGWKHKEWMREGWLHVGRIEAKLRVLPWSWRVTPNGQIERVGIDAAKISAAAKEASELSYALYEKMSLKPLQVDKRPIRSATSLSPSHTAGTARAGSSRENSVCNSEFECHDIDQLLFTSLAAIPGSTFCRACGPAAQSGSYAYRAFLKNHFSKGCSTKGFA
jgi:hypothetical protein